MEAIEQFVVDKNGHKIAVTLPLKVFEKIQEDLHDLAVVAERREESDINLDELKKSL